MRLLLFSDLHLDRPFGWLASEPEAARRLRHSLRSTLQRIVEVATERKVDALLCGGDLYEHEHHSGDTFRFLTTTFEQASPIPVYVAPGNHDWYGSGSLYSRTDWPDNVHIFREDRFEPVALSEGVTLWGIAHQSPSTTRNLLEDFAVDRGGVHLALFHGSERSGFPLQGDSQKVQHAPFEEADIGRAGFDHAFLGHYHVPRHTTTLTYPGNPHPLAFGEGGVRGAVLCEVSSDGIAAQTIPVTTTRFHDVDVDVGGCESVEQILERVRETAAGLDGFARVSVYGELPSDLSFSAADMEQAELTLTARFHVGPLTSAYDLDTIAEERSVRGEFVRLVRQADLDDDFRGRVLITGLRALEDRDDLEVL